MDLKEAVEVLATIRKGEFFSILSVSQERITLDGTFTIKQLEAMITIFKHKDQIHLLE